VKGDELSMKPVQIKGLSKLHFIKSKTFGTVQCDFYWDEKENVIMTGTQIGRALEYSDPHRDIEEIHKRNYDRINRFSTFINLPSIGRDGKRDGSTKDLVLYQLRGIYEICRFSDQPKADEFMDWVRDEVEAIQEINRRYHYNYPKANDDWHEHKWRKSVTISIIALIASAIALAVQMILPVPGH
jgi:prophage antirepressor-like protein